jgi:hypothetical protein
MRIIGRVIFLMHRHLPKKEGVRLAHGNHNEGGLVIVPSDSASPCEKWRRVGL